MSSSAQRVVESELTDQQIRKHTFPRLVRSDEIFPEERAQYGYARCHAGELVELLVHRDGDVERRLTDDDVARVGATDLFTLAQRRLRGIASTEREVVCLDGAEFHVLRSPSEYFSSKLIHLPWALPGVLGRVMDGPHGALVSVPSRRELVVGRVGENIPATLTHLARYTLMTYEDCRDPLSGSTYWWRDGTLTPVVTLDGTGHVEFGLPPEFIDAAQSGWNGPT